MRTERREAEESEGLCAILSGKTCRALTVLIALQSISAQARFAPREVLFASLTLRAARNYVRYSAALRSYSGFVEMIAVTSFPPIPFTARRYQAFGANVLLLGPTHRSHWSM